MGIQEPGRLSLGEWIAICRQWSKAHGDGKPDAPTGDEFDLAVMQARGAA